MKQPESPAAASWARPTVLVPVLLLLALVGGWFPSFSLVATGYVLALGGALVALGSTGRVPRRASPARLTRGAGWWLLPVLLLGLVELVDLLAGSTPAHPSVSGVLDPVLATYPGRVLGYVAWLGAFWTLVRR
jgi:hypothetical protein